MITAIYLPFRILKDSKINYYPWFIWLLASGFLFYKYVLQVSPSIMTQALMLKFNLSGQSLGNLAAFYFYAYMVMQLPGGLLLDRIRLLYILPLAIFICAVGAFIFAISENFFAAALGRLLIGFGGSFSAIGTMKLISIYFPKERFAFVSGLMMSIGMLGAVGGQAPLAYIANRDGWQFSLYLCAIVGFVLCGLMYAGLKFKSQVVEHQKTETNSAKLSFIFQLKTVAAKRQCWSIALFSGLAFTPISTFGGLWGVPFLVEKMQLNTTQAAWLISLIFIGFACGCPLSGFFSSKVKSKKNLMCTGTALGLILLIVIIYVPISSYILISLLMFGFGFFTSFFFISFSLIKEANPVFVGGTAIGFINSLNALFDALSEPAVGRLLDIQSNSHSHIFELIHYQKALSVLVAAMGLALIIAYFIKDNRIK